MDVLKSDENKTLEDDEEIDEMSPVQTELTNESGGTIEYLSI